MFEGIRRLFRRAQEAPEPGSLVQELWVGAMSGPEEGRFLEIEAPGYSARFVKAPETKEKCLELALERTDLFAWTEAPLYRHSDFALEGEFAIPRGQARSACGFLFRYQDEGNFYSVLVSNKGYFRLDVVFNGSPRALVAWTEISRPPDVDEFSLRVIARGGHFTIIIDDEWAAEAADESFNRGHIAFAAQNYGEGERARFNLRSCMVDSRPMELETWYYRWNYFKVPDSVARRRLAETLFAMGDNLAAAVQLRKIEKRRPLDANELFLKAESALRLGLEAEAEEALDACIALDPGRSEAVEEKADILHLRGRYLELRDLLETILPGRRDNSRLLCLSGHARFGLGDYLGAAAEYRAAADLALHSGEDAGQALSRMNEARAWDQAGKKTEAADAYLAAARLFSAQEADDDLALALQRLSALKAKNAEVREIKGKALYRAGKKDAAARILAELVVKGSRDSGTHYTLGLILAEKGQGEKALERFEAALTLEPDFPLYAFRYAERLFLLGRDARAAIERALECRRAGDKVEGWTLNLAGQEAMARGDLAAARGYLEAARTTLPGAREPSINLADLESREGRIDEALAALAPFPEDAACRNQAGNVYARAAGPEKSAERLEAAVREYLRATVLDPSSAEYQGNLAAAYLELERYSEAEERIRKALDLGGGSRALLIAGNLATVYGDLPRAEAAYRLGLAESPEDPALLAALGRCYLALRNVAKAEAAALRLGAVSPERAARLRLEIEDATTEPLSCSTCGRIWRVPRSLPRQSSANVRAMPPDESPAGECPRCGRIFCIACRKAELADSRFTCPDCGETLRLTDNRLRYLVRESIRRAAV
ncbi:MAG: tetratricopeptide repeat protein [Rectinemataceae bacterium]|jgi:tetratricopeptide (TPR) repeat protein